MKLLVVVLVVCIANLANGRVISSAPGKLASDVLNIANRAKGNQNQNSAQGVENVTSSAAKSPVTPAKMAAKTTTNAVTTSTTTKAVAVTKAPATVAPSKTVAPSASAAPSKPVATAAPVARLVPVKSVSSSTATSSSRGSKALAYAEAIATITSDDAYNLSDETASDTNSEGDSEILRYEAEVKIDGYRYSYETSNGISAEAIGESKNVNGTDVIVMKGFYEYTDKEGKLVHVDYTADEEGFHPESDVLPTAPPVPEAIAEAVKYILSLNEAKEDSATQ